MNMLNEIMTTRFKLKMNMLNDIMITRFKLSVKYNSVNLIQF